MNNKLSFAIIGCGRIGKRHAEHIERLGNLVAVCDIDVSAADELANAHKTKAFYNLNDFLKAKVACDVVAICTPNGLHAAHSIDCLKAGYHVLCEKPMAISAQDCGSMIQAAEAANKRLFVVKQNRFNPPVAKVKQLLIEEKLGKIMSVQLNCFWNRNEQYYANSWKGSKDLDGGTLFTQFSHFIDLLYWMVGDVREVAAFTGNYTHQNIIEFEDTGTVILKFINGAIGTVNYTVNSFEQNMEGSLTLFCEKGTVKIGGQYLNELDYCQIADYQIEELPKGNPPNQYGHYVGSMSNHDKVYENVIDVLQNGGAIATNMFEGLKTVEIIQKIYDAAEKAK